MHYMSLQTLMIMLLVSTLPAPKIRAAACSEQVDRARIEQRHKDKALMRAIKIADVPNVAALLKNGANPNYRRSLSGETALMAAVRARAPRERMFDLVIVTRMLLEQKADVNAIKTLYDNITALHCVVSRTDITNGVALTLIAYLLYAGADRSIAAKSTYAQSILCRRSFTPYQQAVNVAMLFKDLFPLLSCKFVCRAEFIRQYTPRRRIHIKNDDWLPPSAAVAQVEKAINTLRVNDAYCKHLAQNSGLARRSKISQYRSDLFNDGW